MVTHWTFGSPRDLCVLNRLLLREGERDLGAANALTT